MATVLCLAWPRLFFPLVWVSVLLLADPFVHAREPDRSLLGDLEQGRPGRLVRLLLGGLAIGVLWQIYNVMARARWIYTVPGFEEWKLFEMPILGLLGFPVFAISGLAAWQALVVAGLAVPPSPWSRWTAPPSPRRRPGSRSCRARVPRLPTATGTSSRWPGPGPSTWRLARASPSPPPSGGSRRPVWPRCAGSGPPTHGAWRLSEWGAWRSWLRPIPTRWPRASPHARTAVSSAASARLDTRRA